MLSSTTFPFTGTSEILVEKNCLVIKVAIPTSLWMSGSLGTLGANQGAIPELCSKTISALGVISCVASRLQILALMQSVMHWTLLRLGRTLMSRRSHTGSRLSHLMICAVKVLSTPEVKRRLAGLSRLVFLHSLNKFLTRPFYLNA